MPGNECRCGPRSACCSSAVRAAVHTRYGPPEVVRISDVERPSAKPHELLVEIIIPKENVGKPAHFLKFGLRKGQALALVNVAAALWVDWDKKTFVAPRIALGAVAPTVIHAASAERYLEGKSITAEEMLEAGKLAVNDAKPINDFRASAAYRRDLIAVLTKRALESAWELAQKKRQARTGKAH